MSFDRIQNTISQQLEPVVLPAAAGGMLSGVVYNTAGLVVAYRTELTSTWTTLTLVAGTVGTWVSSSWVQDTTGPLSGGAGLYQLCLPSAAYNQSGATRLFIMVALSTIQNGYVLIERDLGAANPQDGQRLGLTALPASGAAATETDVSAAITSAEPITTNITQVGGIAAPNDGAGRLQAAPAAYPVTLSITTSQTTLTVAGVVAASPHMLLLSSAMASEIVKVTANSYTAPNTTLTVVRAQFGTTALAVTAGTAALIPLPGWSALNAVEVNPTSNITCNVLTAGAQIIT